MRRWLSFCLLIVVAAPAQAREIPGSFADLVEKLSPAVVNISTTQKVKSGPMFQFRGLPEGEEYEPFRKFFEQFNERFGEEGLIPREQNVTSLGSGFIVEASGYIVTNNHVVAQAEEIAVTLHDESKYEAEIVGRDAKTDIALLKIETKKPLPFVRFGDSDAMRVGDWVIAIGNPFGLGGSVSAGIISARSRNINAGPFDDFIQTDAAINRGNSGGPLFNTSGEVIGVNSAIFSPSGGNIGIGFSIPSALAEPVLKQLKQYGRTHRGWLGVKIQHVTEEIADSLGLKEPIGALVLEVTPDSPAEDAGIEVGDVILSFAGEEIREMRRLPRRVAETKIGTRVDVLVWRRGEEERLSVTLGEMEEDETEQQAGAPERESAPEPSRLQEYRGLKLATLTRSLRKDYKIAAEEGVLVLGVEPGTAGDTSGLRRYDVIVSANQAPVDSVESFTAALDAAADQDKKHALLRVSRGGAMLFLTMPVK